MKMTEWHGGKGSRDRTKDRDKFNESFEKIFGKKRHKGKKVETKKRKGDWLKIIQKRLCNAEKPDCTCPTQVTDIALFVSMCSCAVAHACTYAQARLKPPLLQVCAVVRMCISIENYRKVCINIHLYLGEIGFSKRNIVRI